jgi:protein-L-isoaspartate(D-aspartate) O-methyltransferase
VTPAEPDEARQRNERLIEHLQSTGALSDPAVAAAFRAVLRHHFLPGRPLDEVYEDAAIMTKTGESGMPVSSSSQPAIMAIMLQLLRPRPGHRVLEIGAGTGYNAALIAHLVGPGGRVVTVDIDPEVAEQARANLEAAGIARVEVALADGAGGWPAGAPYDALMITASTDDLAPAWVEQLAERGRMVLPLALAGPAQLCAAFVREEGSLTASELCQCGFIPLRGDMAPSAGPPDDDVARWLGGEGRDTGRAVPGADLRSGFEVWLGLTERGYVRVRGSGWPAGFGLRDEGGVAMVAAGEDEHRIVAYGEGERAARRLSSLYEAWARRGPALDRLRIVATPSAGPRPATESLRVVRRPRFTFAVSER